MSMRFRAVFAKYSRESLGSGMTGKEIAEKMLAENGIHDVKVMSVQGMLGDHYNPANKTVNLSPEVYGGSSVAAAAVAAHECGHAVQHRVGYSWLKFRSAVVPFVSATSNFVPFLLIGGILLLQVFPFLLLLGIILFAATTVFSIITLPVEFDASRRALAWLDSSGIARGANHEDARKALWWAAMTYVVSAIGSIATLLYYLNIYNSSRD